MYLLFLIFLTAYALTVPNPISHTCKCCYNIHSHNVTPSPAIPNIFSYFLTPSISVGMAVSEGFFGKNPSNITGSGFLLNNSVATSIAEGRCDEGNAAAGRPLITIT